MSTRYPGGFINRSAPVVVGPTNGEGGSAPGVWTLEQAGYYRRKNQWPVPLFSGARIWGSGTAGATGQNNRDNLSNPTQIGPANYWSTVVMGSDVFSGVSTSGMLLACGNNYAGALGLNDTVARSSPTQVGALTTWASGYPNKYLSMYATKTDGTLWSCGYNDAGELGIGDLNRRSSPVQVGSQTDWSYATAGYQFATFAKTNGTLWSCGANGTGELGLNIAYSQIRNSPVQIGSQTDWAYVRSGNNHTLAVKTGGSLWSWGSNGEGQLGLNLGNSSHRSSPVQVGALTTWLKVACGEYISLAIKTNGTLWSWGKNNQGQLGQNDTINRSSPVQVGTLTDWSSITAGKQASAAIKTNNTLWVFGRNNLGQLGLNDTNSRSSPVQLGSLNSWTLISMGTYTTSGINVL